MRYTLGYTSRFEFIMKAIGLRIEEIQNNLLFKRNLLRVTKIKGSLTLYLSATSFQPRDFIGSVIQPYS